MTAYNFVEEKLEEAMLAVLTAQGATASLTTSMGFDEEEIVLPHLSVICESSVPEVIGDRVTGNWTCQVSLVVKTHIRDTTRSAHGALAAQVRDVAMLDDICSLLNESGQDILVQLVTPGTCQRSVDGHSRLTTQQVEVFVSASDVS